MSQIDKDMLISTAILFSWLIKDAKIYDFATVATFTLCFVLLHRHKIWQYHVAYLAACINRETAFLLTIFFGYHFYRKLETRMYVLSVITQVLIFGSVRLMMLVAFRDNPGMNMQFNFFGNLKEFADSPVGTVAVIAVFIIVTWLVARNWRYTPKFLQDVIITFTPLLLIMWLLFGRAFELRVFLELFPVLFVVILGYETSRTPPRLKP